jgi:hypothetical protein
MAAPNILGQSGYLYTPDGTVLGNMCVDVGYHHAKGDPQIFLRPGIEVPRPVIRAANVNSYHVAVGIANHLELGLTAFNTGESDVVRISPNAITTEGGTSFLANGKVALLKPTSPIQIVGGVVDAFDTLQRSAYGYVSFNAGSYIRHVPLVSLLAKKMQIGAGYGSGYLEGPFANASVSIGPNLELMGEVLENDLEGVSSGVPGYQYNIGGRFRTGKLPGLALDIGTTNLTGSNELTYGLSYTYCPKKKHHKKMDDGGDGGDGNGAAPGKGAPPSGTPKSSALAPAGRAGAFRTF